MASRTVIASAAKQSMLVRIAAQWIASAALAMPAMHGNDCGSDALSFVERHGLWSKEQQEAASRLRRIVEEQKLEVIRLSFPDQHGILRGKTLVGERGDGVAGERLLHHHHDAGQGHLAPHGVSGVHAPAAASA